MKIKVNDKTVDFANDITLDDIILDIAIKEECPVEYIYKEKVDIRNNGYIKYILIPNEISEMRTNTDVKNMFIKCRDIYWKDRQFQNTTFVELVIFSNYRKTKGNRLIDLTTDSVIISSLLLKKIDGLLISGIHIGSIHESFNMPNKAEVENFLKEKIKEIQSYRNKQKTEKELKKKIPKVEVTDYIKDSYVVILKTEVSQTSVEIFNNFKPDETIPFIAIKMLVIQNLLDVMHSRNKNEELLKTYYKLFTPSDRDFRFPVINAIDPDSDDDSENSENIAKTNRLYFMIKNISNFAIKYNPVIWDLDSGTITTTLDINSSLTTELFKREIESHFKVTVTSHEDGYSEGAIIVPNFEMNRDVFLDLITIEPAFSVNFYVDEHIEVTSQKRYFKLFYKNNIIDTNERLILTLSERIASPGDYGLFKGGEKFIYIRLTSAPKSELVINLIQNLPKMLGIYLFKYEGILNIYKKYIGADVAEKAKISMRKHKGYTKDTNLNRLKKMYPDMFLTGYSKLCEAKRQPNPINLNTLSDRDKFEKENNTEILEYPKNSNRGFYCTDAKYKYHGLIMNSGIRAKNKAEFPYLPCCFINSQKEEGANTQLNIYLGNIEGKKTTSKKVIKTQKILDSRNRIGEVPDIINDLFTTCNMEVSNPEQKIELRRFGTDKKSSFLDALRIALNLNIPIAEMKEQLIEGLNKSLYYGCLQETYNYSLDDLQTLLNPDMDNEYIDPRIFSRLAELVFDCNIMLVGIDYNEGSEFKFITPNCAMAYYKYPYRMDKRLCILLLHDYKIGQRIHTEVISYVQSNRLIVNFEDISPEGLKNLIALYESYFRVIYPENPIHYKRLDDVLPTNSKIKLIGQVVDEYAKRRANVYTINGQKITLYIQPSYTLPDVDLMDVYFADYNTAKKIFKDSYSDVMYYGIKPIGIITPAGPIPLENIRFDLDQKIKRYETPPEVFIPRGQEDRYLEKDRKSLKEKSIDQTYNNMKMASYLLQHALFIYSETSAKKDYRDRIIVDTKMTYNLDMFGRGILEARKIHKIYTKDNKLICNSDGLKKKLQKWADILIMDFPKLTSEFVKQGDRYIDYYQTVSDFDKLENTTTFESLKELNSYLQKRIVMPIWDEKRIPVGVRLPIYIMRDNKPILLT